MGKQTEINRKANADLRQIYEDKGIMRCEANLKGCWGIDGLSWHHAHKRNWYKGKDRALLASFNQTILVCCQCHSILEQDPELTRQMFKLLRDV